MNLLRNITVFMMSVFVILNSLLFGMNVEESTLSQNNDDTTQQETPQIELPDMQEIIDKFDAENKPLPVILTKHMPHTSLKGNLIYLETLIESYNKNHKVSVGLWLYFIQEYFKEYKTRGIHEENENGLLLYFTALIEKNGIENCKQLLKKFKQGSDQELVKDSIVVSALQIAIANNNNKKQNRKNSFSKLRKRLSGFLKNLNTVTEDEDEDEAESNSFIKLQVILDEYKNQINND